MAGGGSNDDRDMVSGINVTPMVDIILVLLIVFMVTANLIDQSEIDVRLPESDSGRAPTAALTVSMDAAGAIFLMEEQVDRNGLIANLQREAGLNPNVRVTLRADRTLPYGKVVGLLDAVKKGGVHKVAFAVQN